MTRKSRSRWHEFIWADDAMSGRGWRPVVIRLLRIVTCIADDIGHGRLTLWAASLVYTTLFAIVPLLAVSFSMLKGFGVHNQMLPALLTLFEPLGEKGVEIAHRIVGFVEHMDVGVLGAMGFVILIVTVVSLIEKIEMALNEVWQVGRMRPFVQRVSGYLSVILIGPVLVFLAIGVTASLMSQQITREIMAIEPFGTLLHAIVATLPYALVTAAFTLIYILIPNTRVHTRPALIGGICAGILWEGVGRAFGAIVMRSSSYTAIYSTFAILVVFMFWLYLGWLILLIGARIAYFVQHPVALDERWQDRLPHWEHLRLGLRLLAVIGQEHLAGHPPLSLDELARRLHCPPAWIDELLTEFHHAGLIEATAADPPGQIPARDLDTIPLSQALLCLIEGERTRPDKDEPRTDALLDSVRSLIENGLAEISLRQWLLMDMDSGLPRPNP